MNTLTLMIQGATSDAGKSTIVTGLCRLFKRQGYHVAPFKPQNMALNSAVTVDGGEIGRAQAVQARAAGLPPHTDMNPVLIKPNTDTGAQIIIHGKALHDMDARDYHDYKPHAMRAVLESYERLAKTYDMIIVEGAGSPAEINLRDKDIANMGFAEAVDCPVLLVADIDRGGVFAHLVGTLELLSPSEQTRVKGFIINRFRGDVSLLQPGLDWLEQRTDIPVLGVLPYLHGLQLESEDSINITNTLADKADEILRVIVPAMPRISNHTDLDPLRHHPQVDVQYIAPNQDIPTADLIILPGSKSVQSDLRWLQLQGWVDAIKKHLRYGGKLIGICGGFQMLGQWLHDPEGFEGEKGSLQGLGFLDMQTTLTDNKKLTNVTGKLTLNNAPITGYEIHMGISKGPALDNPAVILDDTNDGAISEDNQILGTYLHGLFEAQQACDALLQWAGLTKPQTPDYEALYEASIERLADNFQEHLDIKKISQILGNEATVSYPREECIS